MPKGNRRGKGRDPKRKCGVYSSVLLCDSSDEILLFLRMNEVEREMKRKNEEYEEHAKVSLIVNTNS